MGVAFFFDFGGADFIGAGVSALSLADVVLLFAERLLAVSLAGGVLLVLLVDRPDAFFVVAPRVFAGLAD